MLPFPSNGRQPGLPPGLSAALAQAARPAEAPPQAGPPPVDLGNPHLAPVEVHMDLRRDDVEDPALTVPAVCSAVPGEGMDAQGNRQKFVIFTVRTVCQTFTALWSADTARANVTKIRDFLSAEMPNIIMPAGVASLPDLRRMVMTLSFVGSNHSRGKVDVDLDSPHAATWADLLERAVFALSGLQLPGQP